MGKVDRAEVAYTAAITAFCVATGVDMLPIDARIAAIMLGLAVVSALLCIDLALGAPGLRAFADRTWARREERRRRADDAPVARRVAEEDRRRREALVAMMRLDEEAGIS